MYQIGIVGKPSRKRFQIVNQLEGTQEFRVRIFSEVGELRKFLIMEAMAGIVLVADQLSDEHIETMDQLTADFENLAVLCVAAGVSAQQRAELKRFNISRASVLDYNYELKDLKGVCRRMLNGDQPVLRSHFRFATSKMATLISVKSTVPERIHVVDISQGGLQARIFNSEYAVGDLVQIQVPLDQGGGGHLVLGRIAWTNAKGYMGIQFDQVLSKIQPSSKNLAA